MFDRKLFKSFVVLYNYSSKDIAKFLNINIATLYRKMNNGSFTREEINKLIPVFGKENVVKIFFAD